LPRTENDGGNSWKRLRSSLGLARDDDEVCNKLAVPKVRCVCLVISQNQLQ